MSLIKNAKRGFLLVIASRAKSKSWQSMPFWIASHSANVRNDEFWAML